MSGPVAAAQRKDGQMSASGQSRGGSAEVARGGGGGGMHGLVLPSLHGAQEPASSSSPGARKPQQQSAHSPAAGGRHPSADGRRHLSSPTYKESLDMPSLGGEKGVLHAEGSMRSTSSSAYPINNDVLLMSRKKQSLHLMRLVYKEVGEQLPKEKMTCGENLTKMRAEAVLGLLKNKRWCDFFKEASGQKPSSDGTDYDRYGLTTGEHPDSVLGLDADDTFRKLRKRIVTIWRELKFPKSDTEYFLCHVLNSCKYTMEQFGDIAAYHNALEDYRYATVVVLQAARAREGAVADLWSLIRSLPPLPTPADPPAQQRSIDESTRNDLLTMLQEIQIQTVNCINLIVDWRRNLWRPLPFCYKGENYLLRIADSLSELASPAHRNLRLALELQPADLLCITFPSNQEELDKEMSSGLPIDRIVDCIPIDALRMADAVVAREPQIQAAVEAERNHLQSHGKFIATLRFQMPSESEGGQTSSQSAGNIGQGEKSSSPPRVNANVRQEPKSRNADASERSHAQIHHSERKTATAAAAEDEEEIDCATEDGGQSLTLSQDGMSSSVSRIDV